MTNAVLNYVGKKYCPTRQRQAPVARLLISNEHGTCTPVWNTEDKIWVSQTRQNNRKRLASVRTRWHFREQICTLQLCIGVSCR